MRIKEGLISHQIDNEFITIFTSDIVSEFHGLLRMNSTAEFIMECLGEETDKEEILRKMMEKYDGNPEEMSEDIDTVLALLRKANALID